ncbi:hypothetical protein EOL96_07020 [Candidatus Saccharibacteria bacterium]|nr:hypothetical protein [Candidatus Saccharibacteria bacterium]
MIHDNVATTRKEGKTVKSFLRKQWPMATAAVIGLVTAIIGALGAPVVAWVLTVTALIGAAATINWKRTDIYELQDELGEKNRKARIAQKWLTLHALEELGEFDFYVNDWGEAIVPHVTWNGCPDSMKIRAVPKGSRLVLVNQEDKEVDLSSLHILRP